MGKGKGKGFPAAWWSNPWPASVVGLASEQPELLNRRRQLEVGGDVREDVQDIPKEEAQFETLEAPLDEDLHEFPEDVVLANEAAELDVDPPETGVQGEEMVDSQAPMGARQAPPRGRRPKDHPRSVFRAVPVPAVPGPPFSGRIKNISRGQGFGFIQCSATYALYGRDVVVVPEQLGSFRQGDLVSFQVKLEAGEPRGYDLFFGAEKAEAQKLNSREEAISRGGLPPFVERSQPIGRGNATSAPALNRQEHKTTGSFTSVFGRRSPSNDFPPRRAIGASLEPTRESRKVSPFPGPVNAKIVGSSLPKETSTASLPARPWPKAPFQSKGRHEKAVPAAAKKRSFDELFEKTKAKLQAKKEVEVASPPKVQAVGPSAIDKVSRPTPSAPVRPLRMEVPQLQPLERNQVLLLDVTPNSALLVESLTEEILARPGVNQMHFAQPAGNLSAPWRAEILGAPEALQEVKTFLTNTLEYGAVRVVGFDTPVTGQVESNSLMVTVRGLQDAFGQGGACAALMACGRVLQWIQAGEDAFCWLASAEAVWAAQQFLHGAACSNGKSSSVVPDEATQQAVARWRERRRSELAQQGPRGDWRLPTDDELQDELLNDPTIQAAKTRLEDFLCYVASAES